MCESDLRKSLADIETQRLRPRTGEGSFTDEQWKWVDELVERKSRDAMPIALRIVSIPTLAVVFQTWASAYYFTEEQIVDALERFLNIRQDLEFIRKKSADVREVFFAKPRDEYWDNYLV